MWTVRDDRLHRHVQTPDFASSLALAVRIGAIADELDHHPDLAVRWGALEIAIWTHTAGGVTRLDVEFAARCEALLTAT